MDGVIVHLEVRDELGLQPAVGVGEHLLLQVLQLQHRLGEEGLHLEGLDTRDTERKVST
jgi:hypothetical protein